MYEEKMVSLQIELCNIGNIQDIWNTRCWIAYIVHFTGLYGL